jgi:hypothetical protein
VADRLPSTLQENHQAIDFSATDKRVENELNQEILTWRMTITIINIMRE